MAAARQEPRQRQTSLALPLYGGEFISWPTIRQDARPTDNDVGLFLHTLLAGCAGSVEAAIFFSLDIDTGDYEADCGESGRDK